MKIGGEIVQIEIKYQIYFSLFVGFVYSLIHGCFYFLLGEDIQVIPFVSRVLLFTGCWYLFFFKLLQRKQKVTCSKENLDTVAFYGVAHQMIKTSSVPGMLYATENQLVFQPKVRDAVENDWTMDWENIVSIQTYSFIGLFDQGILIKTKGKMQFKFLVNQPQVWLQKLENTIELKPAL